MQIPPFNVMSGSMAGKIVENAKKQVNQITISKTRAKLDNLVAADKSKNIINKVAIWAKGHKGAVAAIAAATAVITAGVAYLAKVAGKNQANKEEKVYYSYQG